MRIAFLGTRGVPATYGGFERFVQELSSCLVSAGHEVEVYCRSTCPSEAVTDFDGVSLVQLPRLRRSFLESPFNSFISTMSAVSSKADIIHYLGCGNVPFTLLARLSGKKVVLTVDGIEWKRTSYSRLARMYLRSFAELAMVFPHRTVADSKSSVKWYHQRTGLAPSYIPYGTTASTVVDSEVLSRHGLERDRYIFFAGRLVHEKGAHILIEAYNSLKTPYELVIVGDFPGQSKYVEELKRDAGERVRFLGYVYGRDFEVLRNAALVYVHPSLLEGTSISLLEALGAARCIVSSDIAENIEVAGDSVVYFRTGDPEDLARKLDGLLRNPAAIDDMKRRAEGRASSLYDWTRIARQYESIYEELMQEK